MLPKFPRGRVGIAILFQSPSETVNRHVFMPKTQTEWRVFRSGRCPETPERAFYEERHPNCLLFALERMQDRSLWQYVDITKKQKILVFSFLSDRTHSLLIGGCSGHDGLLTYHSSKHVRWNTQKQARRDAICPGAMSSQQISHSLILSPSLIL